MGLTRMIHEGSSPPTLTLPIIWGGMGWGARDGHSEP